MSLRAHRGPASLKRVDDMLYSVAIDTLRAHRGAASLKPVDNAAAQRLAYLSPRPSWRGLIEAWRNDGHVSSRDDSPRPSWRGLIEADCSS